MSCTESVIPYLQVEDIKFEEELIVLTFSEIPNQESMIDSFSFSKDNEFISGKLSFSEKKVYFNPFKKIDFGHNYVVEISNSMEDIHGHNLEYNFIYKYTTKTDNTPPCILSISPKNESFIKDTNLHPLICFSETVDRQSFIDSFSISPSIDYFFTWGKNDKSVNINFKSELTKNTVYEFKISSNLTDLQYNKLLNEFKSNFIYFSPDETEANFDYKLYSQKTKKVELSQTEINKLSSNTSFVIDFTNKVSVDSISSYINFYPDLDFNFYPDWINSNSVRFELNELPNWNKLYKITIKKGIYDEFRQQIDEDRYYDIIFSNEDERPVEFLKAFFLADPENAKLDNQWFTITSDNIYSDLNIPVQNSSSENQEENSEKKLKLFSIFRISSDASTLKIPSVVKNIKLSTTNACANIITDNCILFTNSQIPNTPIYELADFTEKDQGWNLVAVCLDLTVTIENTAGFIKFSFNKDIEDNLGNTMTETLVLSYNKT